MCLPALAPLGSLMGATGASAAAVGTMTAFSGLSMGLSAYGQYQQSRAAQKSAEYNAAVSELAAQDAERRGAEEAMRIGREGRELRGQQRADLAARGLSLESGSALSLLQDTDYLAASDQATARDNAAKEAHTLRQQGAGYQAQADSMSPGASAGMSLVSGLGQVASSWYSTGGGTTDTTSAWTGTAPQQPFGSDYSGAWKATRTYGR